MIGGVQCHDVRVMDFKQGFLLGVQVHELVLLEDLLLAHDFECIDFWFSSELDELDSPEGAVAEGSEDLEVVAFEFPEDELAVLLEGGDLVFLHILHNRYSE